MIRRIKIAILSLPVLLQVGFLSCQEEKEHNVQAVDGTKSKNSNSYNLVSEGFDPSLLDLSISKMELGPVEYIHWINDQNVNNLTKTKEIGEINFQFKYLPLPYMISNDLREAGISSYEYDSLKEEYQGMEYYQLNISVDNFNDELAKYGVADMSEYQQRIVYMSFAMQSDLTMKINNEKEVPCRLFHFERTYGVAPYATFLFGFSKEDMGESVNERTLILNDQLFNKGLIKINWHSAELENIPKIQVI